MGATPAQRVRLVMMIALVMSEDWRKHFLQGSFFIGIKFISGISSIKFISGIRTIRSNGEDLALLVDLAL